MRAFAALALLSVSCVTLRPAQWEHWCVDFDGKPANAELLRAGDEGWEMVSMAFRPPVSQQGSSVGGGATLVCFKRPRAAAR